MGITLHGSGLSPFVRKVLVGFDEKSIRFEREDALPIPKTEELLARSPLGKIPYLEVDGTFIPDSSVILAWSERATPKPALYPEDPIDFARALWFEEYGDTKLAEVCATPFFQRFVRPSVFQEEPDNEHVAQVMAHELPPLADYLSGQLGDNEFLVGGQFGVADISVCSPFVNMRLGGEDLDAERWPALSAYFERILSRPSFKGAVAGLPSASQ